jgi:hypothetical protein
MTRIFLPNSASSDFDRDKQLVPLRGILDVFYVMFSSSSSSNGKVSRGKKTSGLIFELEGKVGSLGGRTTYEYIYVYVIRPSLLQNSEHTKVPSSSSPSSNYSIYDCIAWPLLSKRWRPRERKRVTKLNSNWRKKNERRFLLTGTTVGN